MDEQIIKQREEFCKWARLPEHDAMDGLAMAYRVPCKTRTWYYNIEAKGWTFCPHCGRRIVFPE